MIRSTRFRAAIFLLVIAAAMWSGLSLLAQSSIPNERPRIRPASVLTGLAEWEQGDELLKRINVPTSPVRTAEEEARTFKVAPGYRLELVAAEPLVQCPIFFEFDPEGRIWVVEYQGYMRDLAGSGEAAPICRLVVLEDTDADGKADKSTVFLDGLTMPRSFAFVKGGILLQEPPKLWFCEDPDGDLRCDKRAEVGQMGVAGNPQHTANGLRYGIDNWLHCADSPKRYRWSHEGKLIAEETILRGQFGVTFDEIGRFLTSTQDKSLLGDYIPAEYLLRNPNLHRVFRHAGSNRSQLGVNVHIGANAQNVFPIRVTPAVTLGALELREDGRLRTYTIVSGVCSYDGHQFPADAHGNVFVPESGGHLIGRLRLGDGVAPMASRFYPDEQEFLASTDERFRPVNARVGPDGALYVADMYKGIIEHVIFMVPWLTKQIRDRRLDEGKDLGRIWRVVAEERPIDRGSPQLAKATSAELIATLNHPNGWHRLTAQRLLVERRDPAAISELRELAARGTQPGNNRLGQIHGLWTLDGIGALDRGTVLAAVRSADERVRATAVRLCERDPAAETLAVLAELIRDPSELVRLQLTLTFGAFRDPAVPGMLAGLLARNGHALFRTAAATGLAGRELEFISRLVKRPDAGMADAGFALLSSSNFVAVRNDVVSLLAQCVVEEAQPERVSDLFDLLGEMANDGASHAALLKVFASARYAKPLTLAREPAALSRLLASSDATMRAMADAASRQFTWPGAKPRLRLTENAPPLTAAQEQLVHSGRDIYMAVCAACHQEDGAGAPAVAPPLASSDWVAGAPERLVRVVLHGLYGPVEVNGESWNGAMPGLGVSGVLDDNKVAAVISYVRRAWGNIAAPVDPEFVAWIREESAGRALPWRAEELMQSSNLADAAPAIKARANGEFILPASEAAVYGKRLGFRPALDLLGPWIINTDVAEWRLESSGAQVYDVYVLLAADEVAAGNQFVLETETSRTVGTVASSGGFDRFEEIAAGQLALRTGPNRIMMRPHGTLRGQLADVRALRLVPVRRRGS